MQFTTKEYSYAAGAAALQRRGVELVKPQHPSASVWIVLGLIFAKNPVKNQVAASPAFKIMTQATREDLPEQPHQQPLVQQPLPSSPRPPPSTLHCPQ